MVNVEKDTKESLFFIAFVPCPWFDGKYTFSIKLSEPKLCS